jgi:hypothetical protein
MGSAELTTQYWTNETTCRRGTRILVNPNIRIRILCSINYDAILPPSRLLLPCLFVVELGADTLGSF